MKQLHQVRSLNFGDNRFDARRRFGRGRQAGGFIEREQVLVLKEHGDFPKLAGGWGRQFDRCAHGRLAPPLRSANSLRMPPSSRFASVCSQMLNASLSRLRRTCDRNSGRSEIFLDSSTGSSDWTKRTKPPSAVGKNLLRCPGCVVKAACLSWLISAWSPASGTSCELKENGDKASGAWPAAMAACANVLPAAICTAAV